MSHSVDPVSGVDGSTVVVSSFGATKLGLGRQSKLFGEGLHPITHCLSVLTLQKGA